MAAPGVVVKSVVWTTIIMGTGYACMTFLSPSKEDIMQRLPAAERKEIEAKLPKLQKKNADLLEVLKKNAESDQPIWKVYHKDKIEKLDEPATATQ